MIPFDEEGFKKAVTTTLQPWLANNVTEGKFTSFDGSRIQYYRALNPNAKAVIVMVHGFCEFFGKFHEPAYNFWEDGYTVYFIEQRGHGGSQRSVKQFDHVDVTDFSEYVEDLKTFLDKVVLPETQGLFTRAAVAGGAGKAPAGGTASVGTVSRTAVAGKAAAGAGIMSARGGNKLPILLYAHSMGGCVSTLFLERHPEYFKAAVLSSPMLKMTFGDRPLWQVKALMALSKTLRWNEQTMPGQNDFDPNKPDFEGSATLSRARYDYQWDLRVRPENKDLYTMNGGTYRWGRAAWKATQDLLKDEDKIRIPVLVCQAGNDVFVDNEGQDHFAKTAPNAKLIRFPKAKHEIYASGGKIQEQYFREVLSFYSSFAK